MTRVLHSVGRFSARHRYLVIPLWLVAAVALIVVSNSTGSKTVAIAIDSTLVRCLLVPAVMVLLGRRAWWLPRSVERVVPKIGIEG